MAKVNCSACDELREDAPNFVVNGLGDTECTSLKNNTGLNPSSGNNDCTDLNNMNDCLIGNMESEIELYDVCDWKDYMRKFVGNAWTMFKGFNCAICGIWDNISNLWKKVNKHDCEIDKLINGVRISIDEDETDDKTYIVAGKGVSFLGAGTGARESQVTVRSYGGSLLKVQGSLVFHDSNFEDEASCINFDNGTNERKSKQRSGNTLWNNTTGITKTMAAGGELLYEVRISREQYPEISAIGSGIAAPTGGGAYQVNLAVFDAGEWAYGQHGRCNTTTGAALEGTSGGHKVKEGYIYIQARMINISNLAPYNDDPEHTHTGVYSPRGFMNLILKRASIKC